MPQMAPMNWTLLFFYMLFTILMINLINYFLVNHKFKKLNKSINLGKKFYWKW